MWNLSDAIYGLKAKQLIRVTKGVTLGIFKDNNIVYRYEAPGTQDITMQCTCLEEVAASLVPIYKKWFEDSGWTRHTRDFDVAPWVGDCLVREGD